MANPAHKKGVRGGHRASATKMIRKAEELLARDPTDYPQLAKIRLSLQEKVSVLKKFFFFFFKGNRPTVGDQNI